MFGRNKTPCVPVEIEQRLLKEIHEEAMAHLSVQENRLYTWKDDFEQSKERRTHIALEVSRRLLRGDLKAKIEREGYRQCGN